MSIGCDIAIGHVVGSDQEPAGFAEALNPDGESIARVVGAERRVGQWRGGNRSR
jgi:hypothetical protein